MSNIAIIPARSGSKGITDKNIRQVCGKPLLAYSIECAIQSGQFDRVFVSTDSEQYARIAEQYGADASFLRSSANAQDTSSSWDAVREVLIHFEAQGIYYDNIMLLQPTSPLRSAADIRNSFQLQYEKEANAIISVTETDHSPIWCSTLAQDLRMDSFWQNEYVGLPRQMLPVYYRINGAIYLITRAELNKKDLFRKRCYAYIMPAERSVDIDTELDFKLVECCLSMEMDS